MLVEAFQKADVLQVQHKNSREEQQKRRRRPCQCLAANLTATRLKQLSCKLDSDSFQPYPTPDAILARKKLTDKQVQITGLKHSWDMQLRGSVGKDSGKVRG